MTTRGVLWAAALWLGFLGCSPSQAQQSQNLLQNGGFETGKVSPWSAGGGATAEVVTTLAGAAVAENPVEGRSCLHVTVPKAAVNFWDVSLQQQGLTFAKGKKYTLSAFLKSKTGSVRVNFKPQLSVSPWPGYGQQVVTMTDRWAEYYVTTPVFAADVAPADIIFHIGFAPAEFWIDNVKFYEGDYVPTPFSEYVPPMPPAKDGVVELRGDQNITGKRTWSGYRYKIYGNLNIKPTGELTVEDATIEMMCTYDREFWINCDGTLRTTRCVVGGTPRVHAQIQLNSGWWYATDTTIQYVYGTGVSSGHLYANRLTAGADSDSIYPGGSADVVLQDSTYSVTLMFNASNGGTTNLDLPVNTPVSRVYDQRNCPGITYRVELVNTQVPAWGLWLNDITSGGPVATYNLRNCPSFGLGLSGHNLTGTATLPSSLDEETGRWRQLLPVNTSLSFGSVRLTALDGRVNPWLNVYLDGGQTDLTIAGSSDVIELWVSNGGVCRVFGTPGTHNALLHCWTLDAFATSRVFLRNASLGSYQSGDLVGQFTAHDASSITCEDCVLGHLRPVPQNGSIEFVDSFRFEPEVQVSPLPGSGRVTWQKSMVRSTGSPALPQKSPTSWVGVKIRTASQPLVVTKLGRYACSGNVGIHVMRVVRVRDRQSICSVPVNMASGEPDKNGFKYAALSKAVTLDAGTEYYVVCQENGGADMWCGNASEVVTRPDVASLGCVTSADLETFRDANDPRAGLVNLLYVADPGQDDAAWYRFDEGKGSIVCDSLGCADGFLNHMEGNPWVPGRSGMALQFDGVDDYVRIPRLLRRDFTVSFWMKTTAPGPGAGSTYWRAGAGLIDGGATALPDGFGISLLGNQIAFGVDSPDVTILFPGGATRTKSAVSVQMGDGQWHHVAATRAADTGQMKLYLDGISVASGSGPVGTKEMGRWIRVGSQHSDTNFFRGQMDELRLYYRVLNPQEVANLARGMDVPMKPKVEPAAITEGFETGNFAAFPWQHEGSSSWFITDEQKHSGSYSARASAIDDNGISTLKITRTCHAGEIRFYVKVASEEGCDLLVFSVDGATVHEWSGLTDWIQVKHPVSAGSHIFEWSYAKDDSAFSGEDTAWLDDVVFP